MPTHKETKTWARDGFVISMDPSLVPISSLNKAFDSEDMYWAKALPEEALRAALENSWCWGLYSPTPSPPATTDAESSDPAATLHEIAESVHKPSQVSDQSTEEPSLIGFARAITDRITFFYLTDVYVLPEWQGQGLGKWLVSCVQEVVEDMPHLRRSMCITGESKESRAARFYKQLMKMDAITEGITVLSAKGRGNTF
ncbi:hypothetical protein LTR10_012569 [Elasticomyces elasticus]|uniref:N-acetyltransferase domain-containing protein n=1 Tax=Exophiala sideris TaxID=1016849 RepID=A0ABR0JRM6_9EURO|nr:hypothetical protein LTR10_012569 [Elasticomyces elasticus]KAK5040230.1 hypothetical protein LTS07_000727 [Exophiala sideris]KAK5043344.1 hypothetical protein LTR13_001115 [Exophiala sideris]KAK5068608.1 hypothetical protein LTR69_000728 [Exophiala sideris]KAK5186206.1 hypothetical protein LTR44_001261 [Eurotiomycetes sp. CCFEE 6388]